MKYIHSDTKNYLILLSFALLTYFITLKFHHLYESLIIPFGDPFTYSIGFFTIIDRYEDAGYFSTIWAQIWSHPNWYWLQNLLIAFLAPLLNKTMTSISFINYFIFFIASICFYKLGISYGIKKEISLFAGLLPWIYPVNYGFTTYASITLTGLDASFTASLYIVLALLLIFLNDPTNRKYAILTGLAAGFSLWGRGNSLPVLGLVLFLPSILLLYKSLKNIRYLKNIFLSFLVFFIMAAFFYYNTYESISTYYSNHLTFFTRHDWNLYDAKKWLLNIPGYLFWQKENSLITISISIICHFLQLYLIIKCIQKVSFKKEKILIVTGIFIYFVTFFINVILFTDPHFSLQNCILQYQPMLIGLSCSILGLMIYCFNIKQININYAYLNIIVLVSLLFAVFLFTKAQTPLEWIKGRPNPKDVESFSVNIEKITGKDNGKISILWYGYYNPQIINYFRVKNSIGLMKRGGYINPVYMDKYYNDAWSQSNYSEENKKKVLEEVKNHFNNADALIIPENLSHYNGMPYAFAMFNKEIAEYMQSDEFPEMIIVKTIEDHPGRNLLVLKRNISKNVETNQYKIFNVEDYLKNFIPRKK